MPRNKEILRSFADNVSLMAEVKALLLSQFSVDNLKATDDDIILGQMVRARLVGIAAIEKTFLEIQSCKTSPHKAEKKNPSF